MPRDLWVRQPLDPAEQKGFAGSRRQYVQDLLETSVILPRHHTPLCRRVWVYQAIHQIVDLDITAAALPASNNINGQVLNDPAEEEAWLDSDAERFRCEAAHEGILHHIRCSVLILQPFVGTGAQLAVVAPEQIVKVSGWRQTSSGSRHRGRTCSGVRLAAQIGHDHGFPRNSSKGSDAKLCKPFNILYDF